MDAGARAARKSGGVCLKRCPTFRSPASAFNVFHRARAASEIVRQHPSRVATTFFPFYDRILRRTGVGGKRRPPIHGSFTTTTAQHMFIGRASSTPNCAGPPRAQELSGNSTARGPKCALAFFSTLGAPRGAKKGRTPAVGAARRPPWGLLVRQQNHPGRTPKSLLRSP